MCWSRRMEVIDFQLAARGGDLPESDKWLYEPKLDGVRLGCQITAKGPVFYTRETVVSGDPKHLRTDLPPLPVGSFLDGEFCYGKNSRDALRVISRKRIPAQGFWFLFDYLSGDEDSRALADRRMSLIKVIQAAGPSIQGVVIKEPLERPKDFYRRVLAAGGEGVVAKRLDKPYRAGRSQSWLKFKPQKAPPGGPFSLVPSP